LKSLSHWKSTVMIMMCKGYGDDLSGLEAGSLDARQSEYVC